MNVVSGIRPDHRAQVAQLFWSAFGRKLGRIMWPEPKALAFLEQVINPEFAISALDTNGNLLGVAGYKTEFGGLVTGGFDELRQHYGWLGALWRGPLLELFDRELTPETLLMDGIFVAPDARGQGIGTILIAAVKSEARSQGCSAVRLDVIRSNSRAKALYEREGFVVTNTYSTGILSPLMGFRKAYTMKAKV